MTRDLEIIGTTTFISTSGIDRIPAKIDTGADSSAIWASNFSITPENELSFTLFAPESPFYTGETLIASDFSARHVRSSNGAAEIRYQVPLEAKIGNKTLITRFTLANRSHSKFPVLIGRRTLENEFLVDVSRAEIPRTPVYNHRRLNAELKSDPIAFHKKYFNR